jgi:hypothetical protein
MEVISRNYDRPLVTSIILKCILIKLQSLETNYAFATVGFWLFEEVQINDLQDATYKRLTVNYLKSKEKKQS